MSDYDLDSDEFLLRQSIIINTTAKDSQQQKRGTVFDEHIDCKNSHTKIFRCPSVSVTSNGFFSVMKSTIKSSSPKWWHLINGTDRQKKMRIGRRLFSVCEGRQDQAHEL